LGPWRSIGHGWVFSEDVVFCYPTAGPLRGDLRGMERLLPFWTDRDRHSDGAFRPEFLDLVASDRNVFLEGSRPRWGDDVRM
jgi:hypothetical protein